MVTGLFLLFLILFKPIIDSDDSFYVLYTIAGKFGNAQTHILHYSYGWHSLLIFPLTGLFKAFSGFNWYSAFLVLLQWLASVYLLFIFFQLFKRAYAIAVFILFFLFIQSRLLLSLNDSNTSIIMAVTGVAGLLWYYSSKEGETKLFSKGLLFPLLLLILAGMLRVHTTALCVLLMVSGGWLLIPKKNYLKSVFTVLTAGLVILFLTLGQNYYYRQTIPNFDKEEEFRQSLFDLANNPGNNNTEYSGIMSIKRSFIETWFLYDSSFVTGTDIKQYAESGKPVKIFNTESKQALYWTFINSRVYLMLILSILLVIIGMGGRHVFLRWLMMSIPVLLIYFYLLLFVKMTDGIFLAIMATLYLFAVFALRGKNYSRNLLMTMGLVLLVLGTGWMGLRLYKINNGNKEKIEATRNQLKEIGNNHQYLFVNTDHSLLSRGFYAWDRPSDYPLSNLVHKELVITNSYRQVLDQFEVRDLMKELPLRKDIILFNDPNPHIISYYKLVKNRDVEFVKIRGFQYLDAFMLVQHGTHKQLKP